MGHLLLRTLLYPNQQETFKVFSRLHVHQTLSFLESCPSLFDFESWLDYIMAISHDSKAQVKALLTLISLKLNLKEVEDFKRARKAILTIVSGRPDFEELSEENDLMEEKAVEI